MTRRIVIVAVEQSEMLDFVGPHEVFASAERAWTQQGKRSAYAPCIASVGSSAEPLMTEGGLAVVPHTTLAREIARRGPPIDTLIVAGGAGARRASRDPEVVELVRRAARRSKRVASVCTGAYLLAAAGVLEGRRCTTHWAYCEQLARRFPKVRVERDPIFVRDQNVWTSAGVTAGIDLSLALVEADLGRELALLIARLLVVFVRRAGGQSQFSAQLSAQTAERSALRELQAYIEDHPEQGLDVPSLAHRAAMSVRHFSRTFRAETGVSPAVYVERVRVETARRWLETSTEPVEAVARSCGFGTPEALRRAFARRVGLSPREYRMRFGKAVAATKQTG